MKTFDSSWTSQDGLKLHSTGWEPDRKPRAAVALVHGLGEHVGRYAHVGEAFSSAGYALIAADLRGHGKSEGARGHTPSGEAYLRDIDLLLQQVRDRYPGIPLFLYGHSLGGILVLYYTLARKPDLKGVIASSPGLHTALQQQPVKVMMAKVLGSLAPSASIPSGLATAGLSHDPEVEKRYLADPLVHDKITLSFGKVMLAVQAWTLQHASEFHLPLLLVHGSQDPVAFPSGSQAFAAGAGAKATLVTWDGLYHETHNELEKDKVLQRTIRWMDEQLKA